MEEANKRIYATTDRARGTLKQLADAQGWPTFVVPDDVGGRYSVLSAVGLLPIAAAGIDIDQLMKGAADAMERFSVCSMDNDAYKYAAVRNILYRKGKSIEILECYEPNFTLMNEWYKQLFGESEGKDNKGLFPASCIFSTDLHSMGQFIQEGSRTMFETIVDVKKPTSDLYIDPLEGNFDGLNFLAEQNMSVVNRKAMEGHHPGTYRRRRAGGADRDGGSVRLLGGLPDLLLLACLRLQRLPAQRQPLQPAGC